MKLLNCRVEVSDDRGISIPQYAQGVVVEEDYKRSKFGYHHLVRWDEKLGGRHRETWVMRRNLVIIQELPVAA